MTAKNMQRTIMQTRNSNIQGIYEGEAATDTQRG